MSLRANLHVLRAHDEDPKPGSVFELVVVRGGIELRQATREISTRPNESNWTWSGFLATSHLEQLERLEAIVRELEICFNVFRLQIKTLEPLSRSGKPQPHVQDVLSAVLAGMRNSATLGYSRELAVASVSSVARVVVRTVVITPDVAQIAATREAGHPAVQ